MRRWILISLLLATFMTFAQSVVAGETAEWVDSYMTQLADAGFAGAVLVAQDGEVVLAKGYGLADREKDLPVTPETVFTTGSITKQFTAAAILKLEQEGKLSVTDSITTYFDNVPADKENITLHQMLTHTAGFPQALSSDDFEEISRDEYVAKALLTPLEHPPGETFEYSNVGYALLAAIIEQLGGQTYEAFLQEHLFEPAGMTKTGYVLPDWQSDEMAHGYLENGEDWGTMVEEYREGGPYWNLTGNGGILSTPLDMYKWHLALLGDDILSDASKDKMFTPYADDYGYGWDVLDTDEGRLITHNGGNGVFFADFLRFTDADVVIYVTSSAGEARATRLSGELARMVFEPDYLPLAESTPLTLEELQALDTGQHALAYLELLAGGSGDAIRSFIEGSLAPRLLEAVPAETLFEGIKGDQKEIGATELESIKQKGENVLELYVISKATGDAFTLTLSFEEDAPHRVTGIGVEN